MNHNKNYLVLGTVLASIFVTGIASIVSWVQIKSDVEELHTVSTHYQQKAQLMLTMWDIVRARQSVFQKMLITDDPFMLDELFMNHIKMGGTYVSTRAQLMSMPMSDIELDYHEKLYSATRKTAPIQDDIRDKVMGDEQDLARKMSFETEYIESRKDVVSNLEKIFGYYQKQTAQAIQGSRSAVLDRTSLILIMVGVVLLFSGSVGYVMMRKIAGSEAALEDEINKHVSTQYELYKHQQDLEQQINEAVEQYKATAEAQNRTEKLASTLGNILETSINEIYIFDSVTLRFMRVNEAARKNLGYSMGELRSMTPLDIKPDYDEAEFRKALEPVLQGRIESQIFVTQHQRKDGSMYPVDVHVQSTLLNGRQVYISMIMDISHIREQEEQLVQREQEMEKVTNELAYQKIALSEHALVCVMDVDEVIENVNDKFCAISGLSREQLVGSHFCSIISGNQPAGEIEQLSVKIHNGDVWNGELLMHANDESEFWTKTTITPFYNKQAEIYRFVVVSTDITETKRIMQEMEEFNRKLTETQRELTFQVKALDETAIVSSTDVDGTITYVNDKFCEISEYTREEIIGRNHSLFKSGVHDTEFYKKLWDSILDGQVWKGEICNRRKDGSLYWVAATIIPFLDESGQPYKFVTIRLDITDHKVIQQQLLAQNVEIKNAHRELEESHSKILQSEKLASVGQLAAGIAHEINTPTQFVGDNTRFLQESFEDMLGLIRVYESLTEAIESSKPTEELLGKARELSEEVEIDYLAEEIPSAIEQSLDGVSRITKIVSSMKDFSHPGSDHIENADLARAIESTINVSRNEWKYIAEMETDFDDTLTSVPCYVGELNQVLLNIIVNAAHAIDEARNGPDELGKISITTRNLGDEAEITIKDSGCGMPEEVRKRIFEPFYTTKAVGKGTGQGLSIAYSVIADKHHGSLQVESEQGVGTVFTIRLPLKATEDSSDTRAVANG